MKLALTTSAVLIALCVPSDAWERHREETITTEKAVAVVPQLAPPLSVKDKLSCNVSIDATSGAVTYDGPCDPKLADVVGKLANGQRPARRADIDEMIAALVALKNQMETRPACTTALDPKKSWFKD